MQETIKIFSPAKINTSLHVVGKRADGYHELQSVMLPIDLGDDIFIFRESNPGVVVEMEDVEGKPIEGVPMESNLAWRAAKMVMDRAEKKSLEGGFKISMVKRIPMGGGLGGGSSNAATVLKAFNEILQAEIPLEELMKMALSLGADVPFFVLGKPAIAEGVGERLTPVEISQKHFVLLFPGVNSNTGKVFSLLGLTSGKTGDKIHISELLTSTVNDLAVPAVSSDEAIKRAFEYAGKFGEARVTGSGSTIFVEAPSRATADGLCAKIKGEGRYPVISVSSIDG